MLTIEVKSLDELNAILNELDVITFLQSLLPFEGEPPVILYQNEGILPSARYQLWDWQAAAMDRLRTLLHKDDFTRQISNDTACLE